MPQQSVVIAEFNTKVLENYRLLKQLDLHLDRVRNEVDNATWEQIGNLIGDAKDAVDQYRQALAKLRHSEKELRLYLPPPIAYAGFGHGVCMSYAVGSQTSRPGNSYDIERIGRLNKRIDSQTRALKALGGNLIGKLNLLDGALGTNILSQAKEKASLLYPLRQAIKSGIAFLRKYAEYLTLVHPAYYRATAKVIDFAGDVRKRAGCAMVGMFKSKPQLLPENDEQDCIQMQEISPGVSTAPSA